MFAEKLPTGVINVVTGLPTEIGDAITSHPDVGKIGLTGSISSVRHIMASAAQAIKGLTLELGGNFAGHPPRRGQPRSATDQIDAGCDLPSMTSQAYMAIKRIYVPKTRRDEFWMSSAAPLNRSLLATASSRM